MLVKQAKRTGLKVLTLSVFANNQQAIHAYKKKFFKDGSYIDGIIMIKNAGVEVKNLVMFQSF